MRTVTFSRILDAIAQRIGETAGLTAADQGIVAAALDSDRITQCWEFADWRELDVIEQRFFADAYSASAAYVLDDLVYWSSTDKYYKALQSTTGNAPNLTDYWAEATDYERIVPFVQTGKTAIGVVNAVTLKDPRDYPNSAYIQFLRREDALQPVGVGQSHVWVRFTRREPRFTVTAYAGGTTYADGDIVYDSTTGLCYESLADSNTGNAVTDTDYWLAQEIPHFALNYLISAGLADLYYERDKDDKAARAEARALERLEDAYHAQHGREAQVVRAAVMATPAANQEDVNALADTVLTSNSGNELEVDL